MWCSMDIILLLHWNTVCFNAGWTSDQKFQNLIIRSNELKKYTDATLECVMHLFNQIIFILYPLFLHQHIAISNLYKDDQVGSLWYVWVSEPSWILLNHKPLVNMINLEDSSPAQKICILLPLHSNDYNILYNQVYGLWYC